jgi:hypothetical protein
MTQLIYEIIEDVAKKRSKKEKISVLKANESWALKDVLRGTFDETVVWLVPDGKPPYTPPDDHNTPSNLLRQNVQFTYFAKGGKGEQVTKVKREQIYIALLESIHPKDADLVIGMIGKKAPKGVTKKLVEEAFPGLIKG